MYGRESDWDGQALCEVIRGDMLISSPSTSPLSLGLEIADGWDEFGGRSHPDPTAFASLEVNGEPAVFRHPIKLSMRFSLAREHYAKASELFRRAGSSRGVAHVALRTACLYHIAALMPIHIWDHKLGFYPETEIMTQLEKAQTVFSDSGDNVHLYLVHLHILLFKSLTSVKMTEYAYDIGSWAYTNNLGVYALHFSLLALRLGHYYRFECGAVNEAKGAYEASRIILHHLPGFHIAKYESREALADVMIELRDYRMAKILVDDAKVHIQSYHDDLKAAQNTDNELTPRSKSSAGHFAKRLTMITLRVYSQLTDAVDVLQSIAEELFNMVSLFSNEGTIPWIDEQKRYVGRVLLVARHERSLHEGNMAPYQLYQSYLAEPRHSDKDNLPLKACLIDIAAIMGDYEVAQETLGAIGNGDSLPEPCTITDMLPTFVVPFVNQIKAVKSAETILQCCIAAREWPRAAQLMKVLEECSPGYFTSVSSYTRIWPSQRCLWAGLITEHTGDHKLAVAYYSQSLFFFNKPYDNLRDANERQNSANHPNIIRALNSLVRLLLHLRDQKEVPKAIQPVWLETAEFETFSRFKLGVAFEGDPKASIELFALDTLENARSRALLEQLSSRSATTSPAAEEWEHMNHMFQKWQELRSLTRPRTEEESKEFEDLNGNLDSFKTVQYGRDKFLEQAPSNSADLERNNGYLFERIPYDALVINISLSVDGLTLFAVDYTGIRYAAWIDDLNVYDVQALVLTFLQEARDYTSEELSDHVTNALAWLSSVLIQPVTEHIALPKHIIFVPSGALLQFPFGALLLNDNYLFLQKIVSQTPSLSALYHISNKSWDEVRALKTTLIAKPGSIKQFLMGGEPPLPMAGIEALVIAAQLNEKAIRAEDMTREEFRKELETSDIVHLCTHGYVDTAAPYHSYISLKERFRVLDMLNIKTNISLVTFSACLTGMGSVTAGEDMIGFSHALLSAGANAFIGALWSVNDVATLIHMWLFYMAVRAGHGGISIAEKWSWATTFLFLMETSEKINFLQRMMDIWDALERGEKNPNEMVRNGRAKLQLAIDELSTAEGARKLNFRHPHFWAPFILVGHAGLGLSEKSHYEAMIAQRQALRIQEAVARARKQRIFQNPFLQTFSGMKDFLMQQSGAR
ncbi:hypothetical protein MMC17_008775 [Xylographa soralifera]|nr:hypothetical protein [Xylographa soralifera]